jgi:hypothetical protein
MAKQFVPTTDEVWLLQNGTSPACRVFQKMSKSGHYGDRENTKQGIYVCTPAGEFLASVNSNDPDRVMAMMRKGWKKWNDLPVTERTQIDASLSQPHRRVEASEPVDGLILAVYTRDLPASLDPNSPTGEKWNRDTAWFSKDEASSLVPTKTAVGEAIRFPSPLLKRLVALHLVDAVKGQTTHFRRDDVGDSEVTATITKVTDDQIELELRGHTRASTERRTRRSSPHGVVTRLLGTATFDLKERRFVKFDVVALGKRWGHTEFNFRRNEKQQISPIGFVLKLAPADEPPNVPAFFWEYRAPWMNP